MIRLWILGASVLLAASAAQAEAVFEYMSYQGRDPVEDAMPAPPGNYRNPIIPGFHPDSGTVRDGIDPDIFFDDDGRVLATEHDGLLFTGTITGLYAEKTSV